MTRMILFSGNMIREIKGFKILQGLRGRPPADLEALADALMRLSVLAAAGAERIDSIDVNPFLVLPVGRGAAALDALIVPRVREPRGESAATGKGGRP